MLSLQHTTKPQELTFPTGICRLFFFCGYKTKLNMETDKNLTPEQTEARKRFKERMTASGRIGHLAWKPGESREEYHARCIKDRQEHGK